MATSEQLILDELLEEIFLRLPTATDLARASMVCISFRRVIAGHAFLRRFRVLHPPPLLGIVSYAFLPAQPPHPSSAVARAVADGADFRCSFLPSLERWRTSDVRDGRVLLAGAAEGNTYPWDRCAGLLRHFAVCDPLCRRYLVLPVIPDDLAALVQEPDIDELEYFLAPPATEDVDGVSFRVMCLAWCKTKLVLFIFSRGAGQWRSVTFDPGYELESSSKRYYLRRCFCWAVLPDNKLLMLDTERMRFSAINLPLDPCPERYELTFVDAGKGRLGMFTIHNRIDREQGGEVIHLRYDILQTNRENATRWELKAMIPLPLTCWYYTIIGVSGGYLLLLGSPKDESSSPSSEVDSSEVADMDCFSVNLQNGKLEWFCRATDENETYEANNLYAGFPPSLSAPTI
ncbi:unnamed protein product [Alopecurus aequalis]